MVLRMQHRNLGQGLAILAQGLASLGKLHQPAQMPDARVSLRDLTAEGCRIKLVQVYTVARGTAEASAAPLSDSSLDGIVEQVRAMGLSAEAFYGPR